MQIDLNLIRDILPQEFANYSFLPWTRRLLQQHADAKYSSFCDELDSHVFPCLGDANGCLKLMNEISCRVGFVPQATWLLVYSPPGCTHLENCGTVQGIKNPNDIGSIQNLGISKAHRGKGLGTELLLQSLRGFASVGVSAVSLEVTAHNEGALKLYKNVGFTVTNIVYKSADLAY